MIKNIEKFVYVMIATVFVPVGVNAQAKGPMIENPLPNVTSIPALVAVVLEFVIKIGTFITVLAIIWSGFLFIKAQGNSTKIEEARKVFLYAVIGGVIIIGSQVLATVICNTAVDLGAGVKC